MLPVDGRIEPFLLTTFAVNEPSVILLVNVSLFVEVAVAVKDFKVGLSDVRSISAEILNSTSAIVLYPAGVWVSESL